MTVGTPVAQSSHQQLRDAPTHQSGDFARPEKASNQPQPRSSRKPATRILRCATASFDSRQCREPIKSVRDLENTGLIQNHSRSPERVKAQNVSTVLPCDGPTKTDELGLSGGVSYVPAPHLTGSAAWVGWIDWAATDVHGCPHRGNLSKTP